MLRSVVDWSAGSLKQIRTTQCSNQSLSLVAQRCPNLEFLSINSCPNVTDSSMADIAFRCPMIRELDISYCHEVSHESGVDWEELPKSENLGTEYDELVRSIPTHWCCSGRVLKHLGLRMEIQKLLQLANLCQIWSTLNFDSQR